MASADAAKALGEPLGEIAAVEGRTVVIRTGKPIANGDGLSFVGQSDRVSGARVEVAQGNRVTLREDSGLVPGMKVYRNLDACFEKELEKNMPRRVIDVALEWRSYGGETCVTARAEGGICAGTRFADTADLAGKPEAALSSLRRQLGKHTGPFSFRVAEVETDTVRFHPAAFLNGIRRELADALLDKIENRPRREVAHIPVPDAGALNRSTLAVPGELLRSRYCIRWELGLCPKGSPGKPGLTATPLFLVNNGQRLRLVFDCRNCEMVVTA